MVGDTQALLIIHQALKLPSQISSSYCPSQSCLSHFFIYALSCRISNKAWSVHLKSLTEYFKAATDNYTPLSQILQTLSNAELELKTYKQKYEEESRAHHDTVARFKDDKKRVMSNEDANRTVVKGINATVFIYHKEHC